ncbi:MAG: hypothetical protein ACR2PV_02385 [Gammaproteobacteria bacterium]
MKKLILLLLSFTLSFQVFAEEVSQKYLDEALEIERNFLLAVTTGINGEHEIGKRPYRMLTGRNPTFYISTKKCKTEKCFESRDRAYNSAIAFANDYNEFAVEKNVSVSGDSSWGAIPIYLVENLNSFGRWNCKYTGGNFRNCQIRVRVNRNDHIGQSVAHEMLNVLGIQDTQQSVFRGCLSYDDGRNYTPDYQGLCEVEKQVIRFALNHLRPGMRKGAVGNAFDKYWKEFIPSSTFALAREIQAKDQKMQDDKDNFCQNYPDYC